MSKDLERDLGCCVLCEHRCEVNRLEGELGVCRVGLPVVASRTLHPAPPQSYTIFMAGCNFKCLNCQNWTISQYPDNGMVMDGPVEPESLARESVQRLESVGGRMMGADRLFFSGGEPSIHLPYVEQVVESARRISPSCKVNFDTNGFLTEPSLRRVLAFATSITFDLKAYSDETHRALTGAPVAPVLRNAEIVATEAKDRLWELRITVVPELNEGEIEEICRMLADLSRDLPVCFLAFRPNFVLEDHPGATLSLMQGCVELAHKAGLTNASWAGRPDIQGARGAGQDLEAEGCYRSPGARLAASYARSRGCTSHPRGCGETCDLAESCPLKRYLPHRSC